MRLRNIRGSREKIQEADKAMETPKEYKGKWKEIFGNDKPIHIEIGMGKGTFILAHANNEPDINFVGIEKYSSVLIRGIEKLDKAENNNLLLVRMDAEYILDVFDKDEVSRIYLNFSDPWPKDRHAKRRLTSKEFLARYEEILTKDGEIIFKTDNRALFDFTLEEIELAGWKMKEVSYDLHNSEFLEGNIMTEYEQRFVAEGKPINRVVIYR